MLKIFKLILTLGVLFFVFYRIEWGALFHALGLLPVWAFLLALCILIINFLIPSLVQQYLFRQVNVFLPMKIIYKINFISMFYSLVAPGDVAAILVRVVRMKNHGRLLHADDDFMQSKVIGVLLWDKLIHLSSLVIIAFYIFTFHPVGREIFYKYHVLIWILTMVMIFGFILAKYLPRLKTKSVDGYSIIPFFKRISLFLNIVGCLPLKAILGLLLVSMFYQLGSILCLDLIPVKTMGLPIPVFAIFGAVCLINIARAVPLTLSGIGVREVLYPLLLSVYLVNHESLVALGLIGTALGICLGLVGGLVEAFDFFKRRKIKI